jgi:hypothetical protein
MIKIPFKREGFALEMKPKISGANLSLEYDNLESSLVKVGADVSRTLPKNLIDRLVDAYLSGHAPEPEASAIDYLQRAMLHFAVYEHLIFLITRVSNDGVTIKKNDDETTAYKYQVDELSNKLITTAWFWMDLLIQYLNQHAETFPEWEDSDRKKELLELQVDLSDFNRWVGVSMAGGEYFMMCAGWIIREVWLDCVCSRFASPEKTDPIARAVCYEVIGRATQRLAYSALPEPIRIDINNEMGKNHRSAADQYIRDFVANQFIAKAQTYWNAVDLEIKKQAIEQNRKTAGNRPILGECNRNESDKFFLT